MNEFSLKAKLFFGPQAVEHLSSLSCTNVLVVTDGFLQECGMVSKMTQYLPSGAHVSVYSNVRPDPSQELVDAGVDMILGARPDVVIAFGGGSCIDATKAILYFAEHKGLAHPYFLAIPTTAGTGSEVTNFAVITRGDTKVALIDDALAPDGALLDASFTRSVPPKITADTGMDVLTHALEAYVSNKATTFTDALAVKALRVVFEDLPVVFHDGDAMRARGRMAEASCVAGIAFTNAGLGINHSLAHALGGGFFNVNSAHPFENPTALTNFLQCLAIFAISAGLCWTFGHAVGDIRQGWTVWCAMAVLFAGALLTLAWFEYDGANFLTHYGAAESAMHMEGKEMRFPLSQSSLFSVVTTSASCGAVNNMHDSLTPIGGLVPMLLMLLGEVVFGGVGAGFYGMMIFIIIAVFVAGLMVGRTPEYLGKKIDVPVMKLASIGMLVTPVIVLVGLGISSMGDFGTASITNPGPHGFSQLIYAWASAANNHGSAFAGFGANTPWYNLSLGAAMWFGRFFVILAMLALAGALVRGRRVPSSDGTLVTHGMLFCGLLVGTVLLVGALTYFPLLALGPVAEYVSLP